jgi:hypothetical protein
MSDGPLRDEARILPRLFHKLEAMLSFLVLVEDVKSSILTY